MERENGPKEPLSRRSLLGQAVGAAGQESIRGRPLYAMPAATVPRARRAVPRRKGACHGRPRFHRGCQLRTQPKGLSAI